MVYIFACLFFRHIISKINEMGGNPILNLNMQRNENIIKKA